jgi:hypothetical protein
MLLCCFHLCNTILADVTAGDWHPPVHQVRPLISITCAMFLMICNTCVTSLLQTYQLVIGIHQCIKRDLPFLLVN